MTEEQQKTFSKWGMILLTHFLFFILFLILINYIIPENEFKLNVYNKILKCSIILNSQLMIIIGRLLINYHFYKNKELINDIKLLNNNNKDLRFPEYIH